MTVLNSEATSLDAQLQRAIALHQQGHLLRARTIYEKILKVQPRHFDALHLSGVIAAQTNNPARAVQLIGRALEIDPRNAVAHCNQGSALRELEQLDAALACYDRAIAIRADYAAAYFNRSIVQRELEQWTAAMASCNRAIEILPNYAEAHCSRGKVFKELKQWEAALGCYEQAIVLKPNLADAYCERGIALKELNQHDAAFASYARAIALDPDHVYAHLNRGNLLKETGQLDAALACYAKAISVKAGFATAHCNRSTILLLRGDFEKGWADFEWRWKDRYSTVIRQKRNFPQRRWLGGRSPAGKTILLHHEQGFGDTLQFCRYATLVANLGATVILQVPKPLKNLLTSLEGVSQVIAEGDALPAFDCYCPLMSLPLAFKTTLSTIPSRVPYLKGSPDKARFWSEKLGERNKPRVGLVWSGGFRPSQPEVWAVHNRRNIPLAKLAALKHGGIEFYSLQKGQPAESELADLMSNGWDGPPIIDHTSLLDDFSDTAALIEQLDLVISVDTSTAHLAAAQGKKVWLLNRFDTCWRWLLDRADSPWYPTLKIYRQVKAGDWDDVAERVRNDLPQLLQ
jgi:tetratricopeptide (TPR) repeat protein